MIKYFTAVRLTKVVGVCFVLYGLTALILGLWFPQIIPDDPNAVTYGVAGIVTGIMVYAIADSIST